MNIFRMAASYLDPSQPSYLILFVTSRCNARCDFCFYGKEVSCPKGEGDELSTAEFEEISKKCGNVPYLLLSGGEPVLRDDLFDIIGYFIENAHSQFITVPSNGLSSQKTVQLFERLTERYPHCHFRAAFSIDFHNGMHDASRGVDGCLEKVVETTDAINWLKRSRKNLTMDIVSIYLNTPEQDHGSMRQWVQERIGPDNHELHLLRPEWPAVSHSGLNNSVFIEELQRYRRGSSARENRVFSAFFRGLNSLYINGLEKVMEGKFLTRCTAGRKFTVISETGKVRLCECREDILGDLRQNGYDLRKVLARSKGFVRHVSRQGCTCTWECAVSCNLVCSPLFLPGIVVETARQAIASGKHA